MKPRGVQRPDGWAGARRGPLVVSALLAFAAFSQADVIRLKNGNQIEGVIRSETASAYQLDIGFGTVGIQKAQVASVVRASELEHTRWEAGNRSKYILHEKYVPLAQRDLWDALQTLEGQRAGALQAQHRLADLQQALAREAQELEQLESQDAAATSRLVAPANNPTREAMEQYNRAVAGVNEQRIRIRALQQQAPERQAEMDRCRQECTRYTAALFAFADRVMQRKRQGVGTDDPKGEAEFLAAVDVRLKAFLGEIKQVQLPYPPDKRYVSVKARLNDQVEGRFMVDTGATTLSITEDLARRLNLPHDMAEATLTLADGSTRKARTTVLRSVEVEGARIANVVVVTLPTSPGEGLDGLLGMNILREFNIQLDPVAHVLILTRFAPP